MPCGVFLAPPHHYVVPSPYKQGESAVRAKFTPRKGYSLLTPHYYLLLTTYYLLLTTYYLNSYFLSFFSPFAEKTLTNFNIQSTCFVNYKGPASAENTYNFSENTNNFSFSANIFSDSPRNFTDFSAKNGIKIMEIPRFTEVSPLLYYKDNKFPGEMQIR